MTPFQKEKEVNVLYIAGVLKWCFSFAIIPGLILLNNLLLNVL
jgi:hypothetical protein